MSWLISNWLINVLNLLHLLRKIHSYFIERTASFMKTKSYTKQSASKYVNIINVGNTVEGSQDEFCKYEEILCICNKHFSNLS